jgi:hypothetical protein
MGDEHAIADSHVLLGQELAEVRGRQRLLAAGRRREHQHLHGHDPRQHRQQVALVVAAFGLHEAEHRVRQLRCDGREPRLDAATELRRLDRLPLQVLRRQRERRQQRPDAEATGMHALSTTRPGCCWQGAGGRAARVGGAASQ